MKCKCGSECVLKKNMFNWGGKNFTGFVCERCNALWENMEDSMFSHIYEVVHNSMSKEGKLIMEDENIKSIKEDIQIIQKGIDRADNSIKNQIHAKEYLQDQLAYLNKELFVNHAKDGGKE